MLQADFLARIFLFTRRLPKRMRRIGVTLKLTKIWFSQQDTKVASVSQRKKFVFP